ETLSWYMNTALHLIRSSPAPGPFILAIKNRLRAGYASYTRITLVVQRIIGQFIYMDIVPYLFGGPGCKRVNFDYLISGIPFHNLCLLAGLRLASPHAAYPGLLVRQKPAQRQDFSDVAACVRIFCPKLFPILFCLFFQR